MAAVVFLLSLSRAKRGISCGAAKDRVRQHKSGAYPIAFTARYKFYRLVYYEPHPAYADAIRRERQVKSWTRAKRVALIQSINPRWKDPSEMFDDLPAAR